jgi:4-alpha-glucanotransferase
LWRARTGLAEPGVDESAERAVDRGRLWRALCASGAAQDAGGMPDENRPPAPEDVLPVAIAAAAHVARAPAPLAVIPAEDLLALAEQPNLPGPTDALHPNWRRRLPESAALLFDGPAAQACCSAVAAVRNPP